MKNLAEEITISVGMSVMTFNVETDLDIANGSRGQIVAIALHEEDEAIANEEVVVNVTEPPPYVLVKMERTKVPALPGLPEGVIPLSPLERTFPIVVGKERKLLQGSSYHLPLHTRLQIITRKGKRSTTQSLT